MRRLVLAALLLPLLAACQQQGMSAHRYGPPPGASSAQWQVAACADRPLLGPGAARGVVFWSHGVSGRRVQWKGKPLRFVGKFAAAGWDVIKVNRNNLHEGGWTVGGPKHVADLPAGRGGAYGAHPPKGPEASRGILFWSRGLRGRAPGWKDKPPRFALRFALADWDVVKVNRDEQLEYRWDAAGSEHVADIRERARKAREAGYRRVVLGGQSCGAAIAPEAASERGIADAAIARAPNHDSDTCRNLGLPGYDPASLRRRLTDALEDIASQRTAPVVSVGYTCLGPERPRGSYRNALMASGSRLVFLDETMPIRGRHAGWTQQFDAWHGECLLDFLGSGEEVRGGETICPPPDPVPSFLLPVGYTPPSPTGPSSLVGAWSGEYFVGSRGIGNFCMFVEEEYEDGFKARTAFGAGSERLLSMETHTRIFYRFGGDREFVYNKNKYRMSLFDNPGRRALDLAIRTANGTE